MKKQRKLRRGKIPVLIEFPPEMYRKIVEYSEAHGNQTKASIIRYAVQMFLKKARP